MRIDLEFQDLTFNYPRSAGTAALRACSGRFPSGSAVALLGRNGAGKSTLCKMLNGVIKPSRGTITVGGRAVTPYRHPGRWVSYAYQNPNDQLFCETVRRELAFGPSRVGLTPGEVTREVETALDLFGLAELVDAHPLDLPFSLRKRVALASAYAMRRPWIVLDEPTVSQDPPYCDYLQTIVDGLVLRGDGVIVISHDPDFYLEVCPLITVVDDGRILWSGTREECEVFANTGDNSLNLATRTSRDLGLSKVTTTLARLVVALSDPT